VTINGVKKW